MNKVNPAPAATDHWTIKRLLDWTTGFLGQKGFETPLLDTQVLLAHSLLQTRLRQPSGGVLSGEDHRLAAVRELHDQCRDSVSRYITLQPVIDGVEGTFTQAPSKDPGIVKFVGNVPAAAPGGGTLRHKGWRAAKVDLPALPPKQDATILAPAEIEIE